MDTKGYKYKETNLIWISLNVRLLHRKVCYLLSWLNRRVPNGTHGGVRGRENLFDIPAYSINKNIIPVFIG